MLYYSNEPEYLNRLAYVSSFIEELDTTHVFIIGDFNTDVFDDNSLFSNVCGDNDFILPSEDILPTDSFT